MQQGSKLVDYSVNLESSSSDMELRARSLLSRQGKDMQTINQTDYPPVRLKPAAFSIETKSAGGDHNVARTQLGSWSAAHFARLRSLLAEGVPTRSHPLLLLSAQGLSCFYAIDRPEHHDIAIIRAVDLGPARTVVDMYKHFAALAALGDWATVDYRRWVEEVLLGTENLSR